MSRVAVVTGGARGIGAACVAALLADGLAVASLSRSGTAPAGALGIACDVTDRDATYAALSQVGDELGVPTVLVSNAGVSRDGLMMRQTEEDFADQLGVHLMAAWRLTRALMPGILKARHGRYVYVSSVVAATGSGGQTAYAAAKSGLTGLARSVAREVGSRGVTANVVLPGLIDTDMTAALPEARREAIRTTIPLARTGTPEDVAAVVAFLCSDAAAYVTGAEIPVDGGLGMGR